MPDKPPAQARSKPENDAKGQLARTKSRPTMMAWQVPTRV
ncbi:hypothetical protein FHS20_003133 [Phyllobacterium endophyticum]|nr:hypothetical protein [Phyllobacterium endophyticum]